ncbi:MAG: hypothetical protein AAB949_00205 [Patescibacteria group bacterium]
MRQIYLSDHFLRQLKPFLKKFRNLEDDLILTLENFRPETADRLGQKLYKVRLKSQDLPKGKSRSFRMIVFIVGNETLITPIAIYFKSEQHDISAKDAEYHLAMTMSEIKKKRFI